MTPTNRDWVGDEQQYELSCCRCLHVFVGHKHRMACRVCMQKDVAGTLSAALARVEAYGFVATVAVNVKPLKRVGGGHLIEVRPARGNYDPGETLDEVVLKVSTHPEGE